MTKSVVYFIIYMYEKFFGVKAMKKLKLFVLLIIMSLVFPVSGARAEAFGDLEGHWAKQSIETASSLGLIKGFPDGSFAPDEPITLSELLSMLVPLVTGERPEISDGDDWYVPYAVAAFDCGILKGFTHNELLGFYETPAIRILANVLFANSLEALGLVSPQELTSDITSKARLGLAGYVDEYDIFNDTYIVSTYVCTSHGIVLGNEKRELMPYSFMTRAEAVAMLLRLKNHQIQRKNGLSYVDPFSYWDYSFTCIRTAGGQLFPVEDAGRPVIKDSGTVYLTLNGILKVLEAYETDFDIYPVSGGDIYEGYFLNYAKIETSDYYSYTDTEGGIYGYSNAYNGYICDSYGTKYEFLCSADSENGMVIRGVPMLPVSDVLKFFGIKYKKITSSLAKASVIIEF